MFILEISSVLSAWHYNDLDLYTEIHDIAGILLNINAHTWGFSGSLFSEQYLNIHCEMELLSSAVIFIALIFYCK